MITFIPLLLPQCNGRIRPHVPSDLPLLVQYADNPKVPRYLMNAFPSPYTEEHGRDRLRKSAAGHMLEGLAIEVDGQFAGTIACRMQSGVHQFTGNLGYWLAEPLWGRGIMTEAVSTFAEHVLTAQNVMRLEAYVYEPNVGSAKVLEKAGFTLEGRRRKAVYKHERFMDELVYARVRGR